MRATRRRRWAAVRRFAVSMRGLRLFLAAALLLAGGLWGWQRAHLFTPTCSPPLLGLQVFATTAGGVWSHEVYGALVFRDWQGDLRWRITPPPHRTGGWPRGLAQRLRARFDALGPHTLSPDGNALALVRLADGPALRAQVWRGGAPVVDARIPLDPAAFASTPPGPSWRAASDYCVTNSGRVLIALAGTAGCDVISVKGHGVTRGQIATAAPAADDASAPGVKPYLCGWGDGLVLAEPGAFQYLALYLEKEQVRIVPRYRMLGTVAGVSRNGTVRTETGEVYRATGPTENGVRVFGLSPFGDYGGQHLAGGLLRVFATFTADQWHVPLHGVTTTVDLRKCLFTDNGRYLVMPLWQAPDGTLRQRSRALRELVGLDAPAPRTVPARGRHSLTIYERPGRLRTVIPLDDDGCWLYQGKRYALHDWTLREDGRSLSAVADERGPSGAVLSSMLLTWPK